MQAVGRTVCNLGCRDEDAAGANVERDIRSVHADCGREAGLERVRIERIHRAFQDQRDLDHGLPGCAGQKRRRRPEGRWVSRRGW
eukprot:scaffold39066_cov51-Phaeocystis_antarctica.AAC.2